MIVAFGALFFWMEYEWIIRPNQFKRQDRSVSAGKRPHYYDDATPEEIKFNPSATENKLKRKLYRNAVQDYMSDQASLREHLRNYEAITFLGYMNRFRLSSIIVTINLGFENMEHRGVIHGMLLGVREQYHKLFISLRSPRVFIRTIFSLFLAMILVSDLSANRYNIKTAEITHPTATNRLKESPPYLISYADSDVTISDRKAKIVENKYCPTYRFVSDRINFLAASYDHLPKIPKLLCELGGFYSEKLLPFLYLELIPVTIPNLNKKMLAEDDIIRWPFDIRKPYYKHFACYDKGIITEEGNKFIGGGSISKISNCIDNIEEKMSLCVYHVILFWLVFYGFRRLNHSLKITPYTANLQKIDDLLSSLLGNTTEKKRRDYPTYLRWANTFSGGFHEDEKSVNTEKLDPRQVELQFMDILDTISRSRPVYFLPLSKRNSPTLEVTFIFDELDKLGTDLNSLQQKGNPDGNDSELHRLDVMKGLLSNMKRIITSSEARYIFLGGRLLHDEWLADSARRQSFLTSIFSDEIYLPSLLTDTNIDWFGRGSQTTECSNYSIHERIEEYFVWQFYSARIRFSSWANRVWMPVIGIRERDNRTRGFIQCSYKNLRLEMENDGYSPLQTIPIRYTHNGRHLNSHSADESSHEYNRLKSFIHFLTYRSAGNPKKLNELLASFMISVDRCFYECNSESDSNETINPRDANFSCQDVLYLPDHKVMRIQMIARIYQQLSRGFAEKIRGRDDKTIVALIYMSDSIFKFHGRAFSWDNLELIEELVHMHRGHDLRSLLHELVEHYTDRYLHRIINGMYVYRFRSYFANEVKYISRHSEAEMAAFNFTLDEGQMLRDYLERLLEKTEDRNKTDILNMLGEMHEFYQEYERARFYYRQCITARHQVYKEYAGEKVGNKDAEVALLQAIYANRSEGRKALQALHNWAPSTLRIFLKIILTFEHEHNDTEALNRCMLCIQFAEAMIQTFVALDTGEVADQSFKFIPIQTRKRPSDSDHVYILEYLGLMFEPLFAYAWLLEKNPHTSGNSHRILVDMVTSFEELYQSALNQNRVKFVKAILQKKIGALCFYKGLAQITEQSHSEPTLYIDKAKNYYLESGRCLSKYFKKHILTTSFKNDTSEFPSALLTNHFPTEYCLSVSECLGDISESILATIRPESLFKEKLDPTKVDNLNYRNHTISLVSCLDEWFFDKDSHRPECILDFLAGRLYGNSNGKSRTFDHLNIPEQFALNIDLSIAASFFLLRAGYIESAAREAIHTIEVMGEYLNMYWLDSVIADRFNSNIELPSSVLAIINRTLWLCNYLPWLLREARGVTQQNKELYLIGDFIPVSALTALCSIGLSLTLFGSKTSCKSRGVFLNGIGKISNTLTLWMGKDALTASGTDYFDKFTQVLTYSLTRHRYPVLNQLNALKHLIDSNLIRSYIIGTNYPQSMENWIEEIYHTNKKYDNPFHFTALQAGHSLYLYLYISKAVDNDITGKFSFDIEAETRQLLVQSLDICHMGRSYYKAIDKLYYLYDDFNDNQIHRNHAIQMAGSRLTNFALSELQKITSTTTGIEDIEQLVSRTR